MSETTKIIGLVIASLISLWLNQWILILPLTVGYGLWTSHKSLKAGMIAFATVFLVWAVCIYIKDFSFYRAPSELIATVFGGIPSLLVPFIAGILGGIVSLFGAMGGRLLKKN